MSKSCPLSLSPATRFTPANKRHTPSSNMCSAKSAPRALQNCHEAHEKFHSESSLSSIVGCVFLSLFHLALSDYAYAKTSLSATKPPWRPKPRYLLSLPTLIHSSDSSSYTKIISHIADTPQPKEHERRIVLSTGDQALNHAISAADSYMRAAQRAATPAEKARLSRKCNELIALAERLKANAKLAAATSRPPVPESTRQLPTSEKTLILRSSRLHGKVFPPWDAAPDPGAFDRGGSRGSDFL